MAFPKARNGRCNTADRCLIVSESHVGGSDLLVLSENDGGCADGTQVHGMHIMWHGSHRPAVLYHPGAIRGPWSKSKRWLYERKSEVEAKWGRSVRGPLAATAYMRFSIPSALFLLLSSRLVRVLRSARLCYCMCGNRSQTCAGQSRHASSEVLRGSSFAEAR